MQILIDADFLLFFCTYSKDAPKSFEDVINDCSIFLSSIFKKTEGSEYIGFFTSPDNYRKDYYPEYKANRKYREALMWSKELKNWLIENYNFKIHDRLEADDCVNIYKHKYPKAIIVSNDKDVLMLNGKHYNPVKRQFVEETNYNKLFWSSMLKGDITDNVKGIPGIGPKTTIKLLLKTNKELYETVLNEYINYFGEELGIDEFYKNYKSLKILDNFQSSNYTFFNLKEIPNEFKHTTEYRAISDST